MTTILLTGFEPFAGDTANPSGDAVRRIAAGWGGPGWGDPSRLVTAVLTVTFEGAASRMREGDTSTRSSSRSRQTSGSTI